MTDPDDYMEILEAIRKWPRQMQARLVHDLASTTSTRTHKATLAEALGMLKTSEAPPNDQEIKQWLEEERMRKYS